jgi:isocitrate dehydrogenase
VLFSLHLKATMMKVSDPIIFGHASAFFADVFEKHGAALTRSASTPTTAWRACWRPRSRRCPEAERAAIKPPIEAAYAKRPGLAMVDSDRGITNLHVPSDVIIDASMPAMIRAVRADVERRRQAAGHQGRDPRLAATRAVPEPSSTTAKEHGAFDPRRWARCRTSA